MILIEDDYRREMMATIDPSEWVAPDLRQTDDPEQPLLQGTVRQMGILKPWAPSPVLRARGSVRSGDGAGRELAQPGRRARCTVSRPSTRSAARVHARIHRGRAFLLRLNDAGTALTMRGEEG